jgi:hypothetical protein
MAKRASTISKNYPEAVLEEVIQCNLKPLCGDGKGGFSTYCNVQQSIAGLFLVQLKSLHLQAQATDCQPTDFPATDY